MMKTPQKFAVSHLKEEDFKKDGLRSYATYRDLGFAKATHGLALAQVIRLLPPFDSEAAKLHLHNVDLSKVVEFIDNTNLMGEAACAGGACEIV